MFSFFFERPVVTVDISLGLDPGPDSRHPDAFATHHRSICSSWSNSRAIREHAWNVEVKLDRMTAADTFLPDIPSQQVAKKPPLPGVREEEVEMKSGNYSGIGGGAGLRGKPPTRAASAEGAWAQGRVRS